MNRGLDTVYIFPFHITSLIKPIIFTLFISFECSQELKQNERNIISRIFLIPTIYNNFKITFLLECFYSYIDF